MWENNNYQQNEQNQYYHNPQPNPNQYQYQNQQIPPQEEKASVGLAILSFIIPIAGLIIFISYKQKRPKTSKVSGICALVSFILGIIFLIMSFAGVLFGTSFAYDKLQDRLGSTELTEFYDEEYTDEYDYNDDFNFDN